MIKRNILIIALLGIALFSCKEEEVLPDGYDVPVLVTKHVRITVNSMEVGDYIDVTSGKYGAASYITREIDKPYHFCNLIGNLRGFSKWGNCNDGTIELGASELIYIKYKGDVTIEYL